MSFANISGEWDGLEVSISQEVFARFHGAMAGIVLVSGISNPNAGEIAGFQKEAIGKACAEYFLDSISKHPKIRPWRDAYKSFGQDPSKTKPSVEALIRRVLKTGELPKINPVVDFYNAFSVFTGFPCGGEDAEKIKGGVRIAVAAGDERFVPLGGGEMEHPAAGEVVYADDSKEILTRMWNWRESDVTKITYSTSTAVLSFDCLPPTGLQEAKEAAVLMESRIKNCFPNARTEKAVLHEEHSSTLL